jgi:hypothetical protein
MTTPPDWLKSKKFSEALVSVAGLNLHLGKPEAIVRAESLDAHDRDSTLALCAGCMGRHGKIES